MFLYLYWIGAYYCIFCVFCYDCSWDDAANIDKVPGSLRHFVLQLLDLQVSANDKQRMMETYLKRMSLQANVS